jgi:hypothetical protein
MSNCKYRIKIKELNNGEKLYIPQRLVKKCIGGWFKKNANIWKDINITSLMIWGTQEQQLKYVGPFGTSDYKCWCEQDALEVIETHKDLLEQAHQYKTKSITYKEIE